jgi:hypothetical protein
MLRTLSLVEWEIRSVFSCTAAFCGATHSAVEHREEGVEAFRQQRVREDRIRHAFQLSNPLNGQLSCVGGPRSVVLRSYTYRIEDGEVGLRHNAQDDRGPFRLSTRAKQNKS